MFLHLFLTSILLTTTAMAAAPIDSQTLNKFFEASHASKFLVTEIDKRLKIENLDAKDKSQLRSKLYWGLVDVYGKWYSEAGLNNEKLTAITMALKSPTGAQYFKVMRPGQPHGEWVPKAVLSMTAIKPTATAPDPKDFIRFADITSFTPAARDAISQMLAKAGRPSTSTAVNRSFENWAAAAVIELAKVGMTKSSLKTMTDQIERADGAKAYTLLFKFDMKKLMAHAEEIIKNHNKKSQ